MVDPKCIKCGCGRFEAFERSVVGAKFPLKIVQCADCGGVIGVTESYDSGRLIIALAEALNVKI